MSEELKRLMMKIEHAKSASMFEAKAAAFSAIAQLVRLLAEYEKRIIALEASRGKN